MPRVALLASFMFAAVVPGLTQGLPSHGATAPATSSRQPCAAGNGSPYAPTLEDCAAGWRWASPEAPITSRPVSWVRDASGHARLNVCLLGGATFVRGQGYPTPITCAPDVEPCPSYCADAGAVESIQLREWCAAIGQAPTPTRSGARPGYEGICGAA